jgi:hypothetical protein
MRKDEGAEDAAIRRSDKLEREIKALKGRIQSSANPDHIPELAKQLAKKEEEKKEADRDVAAAKAKVIVDVKAHHIAKPHPSTPAPPTLPKSAASDPKVMALEAKEAAAAVARKAAAEEARRLTQAKLKQTRQKLEEKVKQDEEAAETATRQTAKVNALIKGLEAQHVLAKARSSRLQKIKENILNGRKWDAGVMSPKDAALKALGPSPERTASQAKEAFARVNSTTPGSATCGNGANCCIQAFADDYCRVEDQKQCTGDATAVGWKPFLTAALPIADAKSITFETRWVKDEKTGLSQEGTILRLRACGEFEAGKGAACFPKEGAGLRFENFFNAPAGACTMAKDIFMVAMAGPFKPRLIKMVAEDKSSNSREAKVDAAAQRQAVKADAETRQKQNLAKGFGSEAGNDLYDLVTQLMETEEGEQLSVSIEPLLTLRGSFQITRK